MPDPDLPDAPDLPELSELPDLPDLPDLPGLPDLAEPPDLTELPALPDGALERIILGGELRFTAQEVAAQQEISLEDARRLWRALGFPEPGAEAAFSTADSDALRVTAELMRSGLIDIDLAVNLARGLGLTMARLSDWSVSAVAHRIGELTRAGDVEAGPAGATGYARDLGAPFEELLRYVWRRHLAAAVSRIEAARATADDAQVTQTSVGFADIVSFTALSNRLSEDRIGDLVELFEGRCADVVASRRGRVIKSLGDSVLFVNDDPIAAFDTAEGIINVIGRDPRMPDVRVGVASGSVVTRLGDVFGPPVNLASRLTQVARRNRIIIDEVTASRLPTDQFETRRLPARPIRGFGVVEPLTVRRH